ncbi:hypothetical protein GQ43DRAFT_481631 [Delitschia confertaspora ATCC 74209]|uniref:Uncharacterized protein n=1 Tax=Delitschia confertaspora ATCC 74209 TaxID=1513339 RepID=A0A9P4JJ59_9PLEO|nr:hypothetical protein GQ43DRAFT_481631 [Delitschia confertaspora ATCC 74209]
MHFTTPHFLPFLLFTTTLALSIPNAPRQQTQNLQSFSGALGGITATPILDSGDAKRPFSVKGDTFVNLAAALQRSCDQQFNACANLANGGNGGGFGTGECQAQKEQCTAAN